MLNEHTQLTGTHKGTVCDWKGRHDIGRLMVLIHPRKWSRAVDDEYPLFRSKTKALRKALNPVGLWFYLQLTCSLGSLLWKKKYVLVSFSGEIKHTHTHTQTSDLSCHIFPSYRLNSHFYNPLFPSICLNHCLCVRLDVAVSIVTHHLALWLFIVSSMLHLLFTACHYLQRLTELHRHRPISILPKKC